MTTLTYNPATRPLIRKLESMITLSEEERECVSALPVREESVEADQVIIREDDRPTRSCFVLEGMTCAYTFAGDGKRQISNFHIPGDAPDLQSLHLPKLDYSIAAVTASRVGFVRHDALWALCARSSRITAALWRQTLIDGAIYREWLTSLGQRQAYSRIAHLLCEMVLRYRAVGLADEHGDISLPLTQVEIGDALGMTNVHVNRSLQQWGVSP